MLLLTYIFPHIALDCHCWSITNKMFEREKLLLASLNLTPERRLIVFESVFCVRSALSDLPVSVAVPSSSRMFEHTSWQPSVGNKPSTQRAHRLLCLIFTMGEWTIKMRYSTNRSFFFFYLCSRAPCVKYLTVYTATVKIWAACVCFSYLTHSLLRAH